jgi:hypothetical protein
MTARFPIDAALDEGVHRVDEVVAVLLGVKADDAGAEQPGDELSRQGQMPMRSAFGQGMCQKVMIVARGRRSRIMRGARAKW